MRLYYIYKAINIKNGKVYIGKTCNFKERKWHHERCYQKDDCIFHRAIEKYGKENFSWEIIDQTSSYEMANILEKEYIIKFNSYKPNGYNMAKGGDGGSMWNARPVVCLTYDGEYVKRYDSASETKNDGFHDSEVLMSCKDSRHSCKNHIFMFEDEYTKYGARKYKKPDNNCKKAIIQCDLNGNFIKEFSSIQEASKETRTNRTGISGVLTGKYKSSNGYIFVYKENFPIKNIFQYKHNKKGKKIAQIDIKTKKIIKEFNSISEAGRNLGVNYKSIQKVIDKQDRTAYGFRWISK